MAMAAVTQGLSEADHRVLAFEDEVAAAAGVRNASEARLVELTARALAEGLWEGWRVHTPSQWLMWQAGLSRSTARRVLALARRASELPVTMAAFAEGRLSADQAAAIARYTPAEYEASVCELAQAATVSQIVAATSQYGFDTEARPADAPQPTPNEPDLGPSDPTVDRQVSFGTAEGGGWWANMRLPLDEGLAVEGALKAARDQLHDVARRAAKEKATAEGRPLDEVKVKVPSWADAAVGVAHSVLSGGASGAEMAARSRVLVHLEVPDGGSDGEHAHWMGSTHLGPALPDELRRYLTCDGDTEVVWKRDGVPVNLGRTKRIVPRRIRRLIEHRDRGCRVPGCDQAWWLQVHHIIHWEDDGETITANLICLCSAHHRLHHQGLLGITGNADLPDGVTFTDQYGRPMEGATRARPPKPTDMPSVAAYRHPTGERLDKDVVYFTRRPATALESPADIDIEVATDPGPPHRRRRGRCHPAGRPDADGPATRRGPPED